MIIREARAEDAGPIASIRNETWQSTYRGIVSGEYLDAMSLADAKARFSDALLDPGRGEHFFVAEDDREVVGFCVCGPERDSTQPGRGEIYAIYVRPGAQRSGTGRCLMRVAAGRLRELGLGSMVLWTLADNPSNGFYERMGGKRSGHRKYRIGDKDYDLVSYVWDDITRIAASSCPHKFL